MYTIAMKKIIIGFLFMVAVFFIAVMSINYDISHNYGFILMVTSGAIMFMALVVEVVSKGSFANKSELPLVIVAGIVSWVNCVGIYKNIIPFLPVDGVAVALGLFFGIFAVFASVFLVVIVFYYFVYVCCLIISLCIDHGIFNF